jgi:hypothetical protein
LPLVKRSAAVQSQRCRLAADEEVVVIGHSHLAKSAGDG